MKNVLICPRKYVQGEGVMKEIGTYLALLGKKAIFLWDDVVKGILAETVTASCAEAGIEIVDVLFGGECTKAEAARVAGVAKESGVDAIVALGGGKVLDTAKAASVQAGTKLMTVPTIASTDSPTSAATVWYDADGNCTGFECWPFNPDIVLVDTGVIARAPVRAFVAGMGDALATWIEVEAAFKTRANSLAGGRPTLAALAIAELCYETLMEWGVEAKHAVEMDLVTHPVEKVVEANVLMSGLGFESGGLTTVHMIANTFSNFPQSKGFMHGEKVGFGIMTQMVLDEDWDTERIEEVMDFMIAVGLPVTLAELDLADISAEQLQALATAGGGEGSLAHNHCFEVTPETMMAAMLAADKMGQRRKALFGA